MLYFYVGKRGTADRAPVYKAAALVDKPLVVEAQEVLLYGLVAAFVHGKALAAPVAGCTHLALLHGNAVAVLFLPCPGALKKFLAAELFFGLAFFFLYLIDYLYLCGYAGVVCARQPQGAVALHPLKADQNILQGRVHCVAHMELTSDVWRRHHYGERLFVGVLVRGKLAGFLPSLVDAVLE